MLFCWHAEFLLSWSQRQTCVLHHTDIKAQSIRPELKLMLQQIVQNAGKNINLFLLIWKNLNLFTTESFINSSCTSEGAICPLQVQKQTSSHAHTHSLFGANSWPSPLPSRFFLDCGRKSDKIHTRMGRKGKLLTETPEDQTNLTLLPLCGALWTFKAFLVTFMSCHLDLPWAWGGNAVYETRSG